MDINSGTELVMGGNPTMSGKRYAEEFKIEAIKQISDRVYKVTVVAERLGVTSKSLYA